MMVGVCRKLLSLAAISCCCSSVSAFLSSAARAAGKRLGSRKNGVLRHERCRAVNPCKNNNDDDKLFPATNRDLGAAADIPAFKTRKEFLVTGLLSAALGLTPSDASADEEITVFQLPSGIKYIELESGTGSTPRYGQLLSVSYKAFIKLPANKKDPSPKPQQYDQASAYLIKHGNGRTIEGLDEGLHTLRVGGTRRLIIPPKLGYVRSGLGPIPEYPWDRQKLNDLLDQMIALRGGTVVFEVKLLSAIDDEADQGYYEDGSLTPEQFEQLRNNIQQRAAQAAQEAAGGQS